MKFLLIFILTFASTPLFAQESIDSLVEADLAYAIFRAKTGPRGDLRWRECGSSLRGEAARVRAAEYAHLLMGHYVEDPNFDVWIATSIIAQESSFNRCSISRGAMTSFTTYFETTHSHPPRERDIRRFLSSSSVRRASGVAAFDAGLAQFRWPGHLSRSLDSAVDLIDAESNIQLFVTSMAAYRSLCVSGVPNFRGIYPTRATEERPSRNIRYNVPCSEGYWVAHNTGGSWFNYRYYNNVTKWHENIIEWATYHSNFTFASTPSDG